MEYNSLDDVIITHDDEYMGGEMKDTGTTCRPEAGPCGLGCNLYCQKYWGARPLGGALGVRIDQLTGDLLYEEGENYCKY